MSDSERDFRPPTSQPATFSAACDDGDDDDYHRSSEDYDGTFSDIEGVHSGYDTDPIERYFVVSKWAKKLSRIPHTMRDETQKVRTSLRSSKIKIEQQLEDRQQKLKRAAKTQLRQLGSQFKKGQQEMEDKAKKQREQFVKQVDTMLIKMRQARASQTRHITCFVLSMLDALINAFWMGYSPRTVHYFFTLRAVNLITARFILYRWRGWHYYLYDMCYWANLVTLLYLWVFPKWPPAHDAAFGFGGILAVSVPLFRNSFVPHSLDRITSFHVHAGPLIMMWVIRWKADEFRDRYHVPERPGFFWAWVAYLGWAVVYGVWMFVIRRKRIQKKNYATLYALFAEDYGILKKLPKKMQPWGPLIFMVLHCAMFSTTLIYVRLPFLVQTVIVLGAIVWGIYNGAKFYMTYFWKVYDKQIHDCEKQMDKARAAVENAPKVDTAVESQTTTGPAESPPDSDHSSDEAESDTSAHEVPHVSETS